MAERPEFVLNVEVRNTAGQLLKYFPVEVRGDAGTILTEWRITKELTRRTDENGRCRFTEVPNVPKLRLVFWPGRNLIGDSEEMKKINKEYEKYKWTEIPVDVVDGRKEYTLRAVILTKDEYRNKEQQNR